MPQLTRYELQFPQVSTITDPSSGLVVASGLRPPQYFDQSEDALAAGNQALQTAQAASPLMLNQDTGAEVGFSPGEEGAPPVMGIGPDQQPLFTGGVQPGMVPVLRHPSFSETTTDAYGNTRPVGPALTKLGTLMGFIAAAGRGAADVLSTPGALDAVPGRSSFATGYRAAQEMPFRRAVRATEMSQGYLKNQELQARTQKELAEAGMLPLMRRATINRLNAQTRLFNRRATQPQHLNTPAGLMEIGADGVPTGIVPGTAPEKDDAQTRAHFVKQHPELFRDDEEARQYTLYGAKRDPNFASPNEWQLRINAANGDPDAQDALDQRFQEQQRLANIRHEPTAKPEEEGLTAAEARLLNADPAYSTAKRNLNALLTERAKAVAWAEPEDLKRYDDQITTQQGILNRSLQSVRAQRQSRRQGTGQGRSRPQGKAGDPLGIF